MRAIDRKLWRDLWGMRGQAVAIALVIVSGVSTFIMSLSVLDSLRRTQTRFYAESHFGDVFASLKRAPENVRQRVLELPGVAQVETRVVAAVRVEIDGFADPVTAQLISTPDAAAPLLNRPHLRRGRMPTLGRDEEVVVSEAFAKAHGLALDAELAVTIKGRRRLLRIVGVALSAEHLYQIRPGSIVPDFKRYGILWMARTPLAAAYEMEEAFNDLSLTLSPGSAAAPVIERLDDLLEPYGGLGAISREDQLSHRYLTEEFRQLENMATIFPVIFLSVAIFLLNVVISRLVSTQREQIAALKAFGYRNLQIGTHYAKMVGLIVLAGSLAGIIVGVWLGRGLGEMYMEFYRFPYLDYVLAPNVALTAVVATLVAALLGTLQAVRRAALLPPAEAMRPEPPTTYRETWIERAGAKRFLSQPSRMILRHLERRPIKSALSVLGIALACAILMVGNFQRDAVDFMVTSQFSLANREDLSVAFVDATSRAALHELKGLPGVTHGEPYRAVPLRLRFENRSYRTTLTGLHQGGTLHRLIDAELLPVELPPQGLVLTRQLAKILGVRLGDEVVLEILEGHRPIRRAPVVAFVKQYIGVAAYMDLEELHDVLREGESISGAYLAVDRARLHDTYATLEEIPRVAGTTARENAIENFYETMAKSMLIFTLINTILAASIACGVVYNSARIALSERSRELASLRVLGFTRAEISYILLGELAVLTLLAIPFGFFIGRGLCQVIAAGLQSDLYRLPLILEPRAYAFAAAVVLVASMLSGLFVRRKLDRLDLIAVLKTKE